MTEGNFECRLSAKRETKAGIFVTLEIQPADLSEALSMLRVGTALMVGWSEVVDITVQPVSDTRANEIGAVALAGHVKRQFQDLPLSQQAALRCQDENFKWFLMDKFTHTTTKYADTADVVRSICMANSRSDFDHRNAAAQLWRGLESQYQQWLTDKRFGDQVR